MHIRIWKIIGIALLLGLVISGAFLLAGYVKNSDTAQHLVTQFGYWGILVISVISGLNMFVPIPAAAFTPVYIAAGFPLWGIAGAMILGTMIADTIGYLLGIGGRHIAKHAHPRFEEALESFATVHPRLVVPLVFLTSAFAPFPNEVVLIPLAFIGVPFRTLALPLFTGTIVYNLLVVYGLTSALGYFF